MNGNANDSSGNGNNGVVTGATITTSRNGLANGAYNFAAGSGDQLITINNVPSISTQLTLSAWIQPTAYPSERSTIIEGHTPYSYYLSLANDGSLQTYRYGISPAGYHSTAVNAVPLNQWTYATATWDGTTMSMYLNGVLAKAVAVSGSGIRSTGVYIGEENSLRQFVGSIDDVRIYSSALSASDVQRLYSAGAQ